MIRIKRAYDAPAPKDGQRFLVDHLWPRGLKKEKLKVTAWLKDVAPSDQLRKWFAHDPVKWDEFQTRYFAELDKKSESLRPLREAKKKGDLTLVFAAKDTKHNNAVALKSYLEKKSPRFRIRKVRAIQVTRRAG